jgi:hypothetical protein
MAFFAAFCTDKTLFVSCLFRASRSAHCQGAGEQEQAEREKKR